MTWYWWILLGILGLNALVVVVVAVFLALDSLRGKRAAARREEQAGKADTAE
jgi:uncharacterized membrane protein